MGGRLVPLPASIVREGVFALNADEGMAVQSCLENSIEDVGMHLRLSDGRCPSTVNGIHDVILSARVARDLGCSRPRPGVARHWLQVHDTCERLFKHIQPSLTQSLIHVDNPQSLIEPFRLLPSSDSRVDPPTKPTREHSEPRSQQERHTYTMFSKATTLFALFAAAAHVVVATPPACLIGAMR